MDGETDYWMDGVDDVDGLDVVKPKLMLYDSLRGERENPIPSRPHRPAKTPHAPLKEVGELEAGEKSGIRPRNYPRIYDRPPCLTHTHTPKTRRAVKAAKRSAPRVTSPAWETATMAWASARVMFISDAPYPASVGHAEAKKPICASSVEKQYPEG